MFLSMLFSQEWGPANKIWIVLFWLSAATKLIHSMQVTCPLFSNPVIVLWCIGACCPAIHLLHHAVWSVISHWYGKGPGLERPGSPQGWGSVLHLNSQSHFRNLVTTLQLSVARTLQPKSYNLATESYKNLATKSYNLATESYKNLEN
jgi:hypothetical protein